MDEKKTESKRPIVRVFRTGPRCSAICCEQCINMEGKDVAGLKDKQPPLHVDCDCIVAGIDADAPCRICNKTLDEVKNIGVGLTIKENDKAEPISHTVCGACLYVIFQLINNLMQQGVWAQVVSIEESKKKKASPIIVPPKRGIIKPS